VKDTFFSDFLNFFRDFSSLFFSIPFETHHNPHRPLGGVWVMRGLTVLLFISLSLHPDPYLFQNIIEIAAHVVDKIQSHCQSRFALFHHD